jgi:phosphatidylglycerol:prolipoprotein diacylglycerol transferase
MFDLVVPSIPLIHAIGRLGCYFAGCCYGIPYDGPGHVTFHISPSAPNEIALFPTQLLESGLNIFACLLLLLYAKPEQKPGKVLGIYITYYAILRFLIEFFRGDGARGILIGISTSQWISLALIPIGLWLIIFKNKLSHNY